MLDLRSLLGVEEYVEEGYINRKRFQSGLREQKVYVLKLEGIVRDQRVYKRLYGIIREDLEESFRL